MGKSALSSSSPRAEKQGRGGACRRRPWAGGLVARGRPGSWGKERWGHGGLIPLSNFMEGGLQEGRGGHGRGGEWRPWAAQAGVARGEWSWGKGRGRARAPTSALGLSREAAERASHGSRRGGWSGIAVVALLQLGGGRRAARAPLMAFGVATRRRRDSRRTRAR